VVGDPSSLFLCAIQGPFVGMLWLAQNNWKDNKRKSSNLLVKTISISN
jgi:hypothetical protein